MDVIIFMAFGLLAIGAGVASITRKDPLYGCAWLLACLLAVAALYAMLAAPLVAAALVIAAAGIVMVIMLFVLMLVDREGERRRQRVVQFGKAVGAIAAAYLAIVMAVAVAKPPFFVPPASGEHFESPITLGSIISVRYAFPFELAGVMLLVAAVSSAVIVSRRVEKRGEELERI